MVLFCTSYEVKCQCQALVSFDRGATMDRTALQRLIKIIQNVCVTHLSSIREVREWWDWVE